MVHVSFIRLSLTVKNFNYMVRWFLEGYDMGNTNLGHFMILGDPNMCSHSWINVYVVDMNWAKVKH